MADVRGGGGLGGLQSPPVGCKKILAVFSPAQKLASRADGLTARRPDASPQRSSRVAQAQHRAPPSPAAPPRGLAARLLARRASPRSSPPRGLAPLPPPLLHASASEDGHRRAGRLEPVACSRQPVAREDGRRAARGSAGAAGQPQPARPQVPGQADRLRTDPLCGSVTLCGSAFFNSSFIFFSQ